MAYNIFTEIDGIKQYLRRFRSYSNKITPTVLCTYQGKAFDFKNQENAIKSLNLLGIGWAIEIN